MTYPYIVHNNIIILFTRKKVLRLYSRISISNFCFYREFMILCIRSLVSDFTSFVLKRAAILDFPFILIRIIWSIRVTYFDSKAIYKYRYLFNLVGYLAARTLLHIILLFYYWSVARGRWFFWFGRAGTYYIKQHNVNILLLLYGVIPRARGER